MSQKLSKISMQKYPPCTSHMTNMAAFGSSNGQSNCKENGGYPPTFHPQQKYPVEYMQWLKSFCSCLRIFSSRYNFVHHRYRNPSVSPSWCIRLFNFRQVLFSIAHRTPPTFCPHQKSPVESVHCWTRIKCQ